jgi:hypothetical protein
MSPCKRLSARATFDGGEASKHEGEVHPTRKKRPVPPEVKAHRVALTHAGHALHRSLGAHVAPHASVSGRSADGVIVVDVRGVPIVDAAKALIAIAAALAPTAGVRTSGPRATKRTTAGKSVKKHPPRKRRAG